MVVYGAIIFFCHATGEISKLYNFVWFGGALDSDFDSFLSVSNSFISGVFVSTEIDKYPRHNPTTKDPVIIIMFSSHVSNIAKYLAAQLL